MACINFIANGEVHLHFKLRAQRLRCAQTPVPEAGRRVRERDRETRSLFHAVRNVNILKKKLFTTSLGLSGSSSSPLEVKRSKAYLTNKPPSHPSSVSRPFSTDNSLGLFLRLRPSLSHLLSSLLVISLRMAFAAGAIESQLVYTYPLR